MDEYLKPGHVDPQPQSDPYLTPSREKTELQQFGENHPFLSSIPATVATGVTDFRNSLSPFIPGMEQDTRNYYDTFGVKPNLLTEIGASSIGALPYMVAPEAAIGRLGMAGSSTLSALGRLATRAGVGVAENELMERGKGNQPNWQQDAMNGALFSGTGAVGDVMPLLGAKLVDRMQGTRLADEIINDGNRAAYYPDVGNIVGSPAGTEKWNSATKGWLSPAKEIQETHDVKFPNQQYSQIKNADSQAMDLYSQLKGKNPFHEDIATGLKDTHKELKKASSENYDALQPELEKLKIEEHPNVQEAANQILAEHKNNNLSGVIDDDLKNKIVTRARNAIESTSPKEEKTVSSILGSNGRPLVEETKTIKPVKNVNDSITEERNIRAEASDLRSKGDLSAARYYDKLADAHEKDINSVLEYQAPETFEKLMKAREFHRENVIPFNESPLLRKILQKGKTPLTIADTLTKGMNEKLLSALPGDVKNKILGDLIYKKYLNGVGQVNANPSLAVAKRIETLPPEKIEKLFTDQNHKAALKSISNSVRGNKEVIGELSNPAKTVDGHSPGVGAVLSSSGEPHGLAHVGSGLTNYPTAPFWTRLLSTKKNPKLLEQLIDGKKVDLNDIRDMVSSSRKFGKAQETISPDPRQWLINVLSKPNYTRLPLEAITQSQDKRKK